MSSFTSSMFSVHVFLVMIVPYYMKFSRYVNFANFAIWRKSQKLSDTKIKCRKNNLRRKLSASLYADNLKSDFNTAINVHNNHYNNTVDCIQPWTLAPKRHVFNWRQTSTCMFQVSNFEVSPPKLKLMWPQTSMFQVSNFEIFPHISHFRRFFSYF